MLEILLALKMEETRYTYNIAFHIWAADSTDSNTIRY